ncbi:GTPase Era [Acholeplasma sp. OttesenSCG-928-E16]|nr:GTPase Era [Acholeplasma sp. OttesenSCG-928-E16]
MSFKSGFVTIIGRPNVGKSTLMNDIVGRKIAITSPKPQTTRHLITGIITNENYQLVFVDTPGMHKGKNLLGKKINNLAIDSLKGMDAIIFMVDKERGFAEDHIINHFKETNKPVFLVINKIDLVKGKMGIDKIILSYINNYDYAAVIPISAKDNQNIDHLIDALVPFLKEGPMYYPKEMDSDQTDEKLMSEIVREKILFHTEEEVPHSVAVLIEHLEENAETKTLDVSAIIVVERDSQKGILIGNKGERLKKIGTEARKDLNKTLGRKIHLSLFVKVNKDWRSNINELKKYGIGD